MKAKVIRAVSVLMVVCVLKPMRTCVCDVGTVVQAEFLQQGHAP